MQKADETPSSRWKYRNAGRCAIAEELYYLVSVYVVSIAVPSGAYPISGCSLYRYGMNGVVEDGLCERLQQSGDIIRLLRLNNLVRQDDQEWEWGSMTSCSFFVVDTK